MSNVSLEGLSRANLKLREENETLKEQVAYLEAALMGQDQLPTEWGLTPTQERIVRVCLTWEVATKEAIATALYWDKPEPAEAINNINVHMVRIRRKLEPFGIEIKTRWGKGFYVPAETRERFRPRLAQRAAA